MAVLSLCCCTDFSLVLVSRGYSPVAAHRLLTPVASLVAEHRLQVQGLQQLWLPGLEHRLNSCGQRAQLLWDMWDFPEPGIKPMSPVLAGGFFTTEPPGRSRSFFKIKFLLEQSCFTILCQFLMYSKVNQLYVYIYPLPLEPPCPAHPTPLGHHGVPG